MWIANGWKEYEVIDTSKGEKLERWGKYLLSPSGSAGHLGYTRRQSQNGWKRMNGTLSPQRQGRR